MTDIYRQPVGRRLYFGLGFRGLWSPFIWGTIGMPAFETNVKDL